MMMRGDVSDLNKNSLSGIFVKAPILETPDFARACPTTERKILIKMRWKVIQLDRIIIDKIKSVSDAGIHIEILEFGETADSADSLLFQPRVN